MRLRSRLMPMLLSLLFASFVLFLQIKNPSISRKIFSRLNNIIYDVQLDIFRVLPKSLQTPIVIVDVDEASLRQIGRWPWRRDKLAKLTTAIQQSGALVIGFDIIFTEEDINPADQVLALLRQTPGASVAVLNSVKRLIPRFRSDDQFVHALKQSDSVMGFYLNQEAGQPIGALPKTNIVVSADRMQDLVVPNATSYIGNMPAILQVAPSGGFTTIIPDQDGNIRRAPLILRYRNQLYGSFPLEIAKSYLLLDKVQLKLERLGNVNVIDQVRLGDIRIPTDELGQIVIPYTGESGQFPYVSAKDILSGHFKREQFDNSIVLIGSSAFSLGDLHSTPLHNTSYPGVEIQATILRALLTKQFIWHPGWSDGVVIAGIVLLGLIGIFIFPFLDSIQLLMLTGLLLGGVLFAQVMLWSSLGLIIPTVKLLLLTLMLAGLHMSYGYLFESRKRTQLRKFFEQYVPEAHVERISSQSRSDWFSGENRDMSVLFCDLSNFTKISESLSATEVKQYLNMVFTPITESIFEHRGTIDKYVGDLVMAFWGAPLNDENHVENGLKTVFSILEKRALISDQLIEQGFPPVQFTLGFNTGLMNVGDMGSEYRRAYTVIGDTVNTASRLEMLCQQYGVECIVSEFVKQQCHRYAFRLLDRVQVKGKTESITIYQPLGLVAECNDEQLRTCQLMNWAYKKYCQREWSAARKLFEQLLESDPYDRVYALYLTRISELETKLLPDDWDGVSIKTYK